MQIVFIERMSLIMKFHVDVILDHISLFFKITRSLEMCRGFLLRMSFIMTFLL